MPKWLRPNCPPPRTRRDNLTRSRATIASATLPDRPLELRGADQPAHPLSAPHEAGTPLMSKATTLTELIESNHAFPRSITYHAAEDDAREVSFGELYERALGILYHCSDSARAAATS